MTIFIPWWIWPILSVILGCIGFWYFDRIETNYDFASMMLKVVCFVFGVAIALAIVITRLLST